MNKNVSNELNEKLDSPSLESSFVESQKNRLCFRNERSLYNRKCDATGNPIVSIYSPDKPFKIYQSDYWYGDKWNPLDYEQEFDFSRPFFEQFAELQLKVPRLALSNAKGENSEYCNMTYGNKNCYLYFGGDFNEDCMYGTLSMRNYLCFDLDYSNDNNLCYELSDCNKCYGCQFIYDSKNCTDCYFISDCSDCNDCILCTNLVQKSYCIDNKQYSREEYLNKKNELIDGSYLKLEKLFEKFIKLRSDRFVKFSHIVNCQNSRGDYIVNSKNCDNCFDVIDCENLENVIYAYKAKDCFDCSLLGEDSELCTNCISAIKSYNIKFSYFASDSADIEYSKYIFNSKNIFGCIGLKHNNFCILNKQYSESDFKTMRERIIKHMKKTGEWGLFFPKKLSDFAYNESSAFHYFPLSKEEAIKQGFNWKDEENKTPLSPTIKIPDNILEVNNNIINEILQCDECKKNYKILPYELAFYKKTNIPIPHYCADCRHKKRSNLRNPRNLWTRKCQNCSTKLESSYSPNKPEKILCEKCYLEKFY